MVALGAEQLLKAVVGARQARHGAAVEQPRAVAAGGLGKVVDGGRQRAGPVAVPAHGPNQPVEAAPDRGSVLLPLVAQHPRSRMHPGVGAFHVRPQRRRALQAAADQLAQPRERRLELQPRRGKRRAGPRLPKNYWLVHDVLCSQAPGTHATTRDIFAAVAQRRPGIGYSTVYRALGRLCDLGLVAEVRLPGGASAVYEPARTGHAHFLCTNCGRVDDIDYAPVPAALEALAETLSIKVSKVLLTLRGTCAQCRVGPGPPDC